MVAVPIFPIKIKIVIIFLSLMLFLPFEGTGENNLWESKKNKDLYQFTKAICFVNKDKGWLTEGDSIWYSDDGGNTWIKQHRTEVKTIGTAVKFKVRTQFYDIFFINENVGWASGTDGVILKTSTGGLVWLKQESGVELEQFGGVPIDISLDSIFFIDRYTGWIVGSGVILYTENGGLTWRRQYFGTEHKLLKVFFVDKNNGWAVGYNGKILHTTTGGEKRFGFFGGWEEQKSDTEVHLYGLHFVDKYTGWAVGADEILHTNDGGKKWQVQSKGLAKHLWAVYFIDKNRGWVGGANNIFYTDNGGKTWTVQASGNFQVVDMQFIDNNHGWALDGLGTLLRYKIGQ